MENGYTWVVKVTVDQVWVADGFELDADRARDMVLADLGYARDWEVEVEVIEAPGPARIRKEQGYTDTVPDTSKED